ncbi:MAG: DNA polymerase III subunit delta [Sphingomonadales bacterium 32-68-7]|nr:MAG: DNA polymerase III subunit delta [Sphingomonadales bacterium 12-68-11]OYX08228.1 MAG: DNA polymerase III subunit delta [Sphingomonadales bacterium 32-68-7]
MKASQRDFSAVAAKAAKQARIAFFCGPDEAGAAAAAAKFVEMLREPGERVELAGGDVRGDPVRLGDEARSTSLFGGTRHIVVRANGDEAHDAVANLLTLVDSGEARDACPVLIVASGATDKSRTAKLLATRDDALVAMFYPPDLPTLGAEIRRMAAAAGVKMGTDLSERVARACNLDVRLAQSEIDKLALYLDGTPQAPRPATEEALDAIGARTEEDGFGPLVNAVLAGETAKVPGELKRMREVSLNSVGVLLALERRAAQLAQLTGKLGPGGRVAELLEAEQRVGRVFFRDKRDLMVQLQKWSPRKLDRLLARLAALHRALLSNSQASELLLAQELTEIARFAGARG